MDDIRVAQQKLEEAIRELQNAHYAHNRNERRIDPIPAYKDAANRTADTANMLMNNERMLLQHRAANATDFGRYS